MTRSIYEFGIVDFVVFVRQIEIIVFVISLIFFAGDVAVIEFYPVLSEHIVNICGEFFKHSVDCKLVAYYRITAVLVFIDSAVIGVSAVVSLQFFVSSAVFAVGKIAFEEEIFASVGCAVIVTAYIRFVRFEAVILFAVEPNRTLVLRLNLP